MFHLLPLCTFNAMEYHRNPAYEYPILNNLVNSNVSLLLHFVLLMHRRPHDWESVLASQFG